MSHSGFVISSSVLATKEKNQSRFLSSVKKERETGFFFFILEAFCPESFGQKIRKIIIDKINEISAHLDISETIFEEVVEEINDAIEKALEVSDINMLGKINSVLGFVGDDTIFLTQSGRLPGYIFRKGKISSLTEGADLDSANRIQVYKDIISGELIAEDKIVFGNNELFNHLSLDRIRKLSTGISAKESVFELFTILRKLKITNVNSIVIDAAKDEEPAKVKEMPEIFYLDEPEETPLVIFQKKYWPHIKKGSSFIWKNTKILAAFTGRHVKAGAQKSGKYLKEAAPKTREVLGLNRKDIEKSIGSKQEYAGNYRNVKVKNPYAKKTIGTSVSRAAFTIGSVLKQILLILFKRENRKFLYIGLAIILIFCGYMKIRSNNTNATEKKEQQELADAYDKARAIFDKAKEDIALGRTASTADLSEALSWAEKGEKYPATKDKSEQLYREIAAQIDKLTKTTRIYSDSKNTATVSSEIYKVASTGNEIYAFGKDGKTYSLGFSDIQAKLISSMGKDKIEIAALAYSEGDSKILLWSTDNKMVSYDIKSKAFTATPLSDGSSWIAAVSFNIFSGNVYLLDSSAGQIIKYIKESDKFTRNSVYADSKKVSLKDSVSLAVDGNVYVLLKNGGMFKLAKGIKDEAFALKNIPEPNKTLEDPRKVYTGAETNYIYVLEAKQNRIVRFSKAGEFVSQYTLGEGAIDDFAINEKLKKLVFVSGTKIISADL